MNVVSEEALIAIESMSTMDELDSEPTLEESNQAQDQLSSGKAYLLKSLSAQKVHSSASDLIYFANAGEVKFHGT